MQTFGLVVSGQQRDVLVAVADSGGDLREDLGEFGADDEKTFPVGLGWGELQQQDDSTGR